MSPSKTERKPNERIKTDKRDAKKIAKLFRNGDITEVRIPPALDEAVRDLCRARTDASDDLSRSKQRLNSFLLRNGYRYDQKTKWTDAHMRYLRHLTLPDPTQALVLEGYIQTIDACVERVQAFEEKMIQVLTDWEWRPVLGALMACKGFKEVAAMTVISELGDLRRFKSPRPSWPSWDSSQARNPPAANDVRVALPNAATDTPAGCSVNQPKPTAGNRKSATSSPSANTANPRKSKPCPGACKNASANAIAISVLAASVTVNASSPSPANSAPSSGNSRTNSTFPSRNQVSRKPLDLRTTACHSFF